MAYESLNVTFLFFLLIIFGKGNMFFFVVKRNRSHTSHVIVVREMCLVCEEKESAATQTVMM